MRAGSQAGFYGAWGHGLCADSGLARGRLNGLSAAPASSSQHTAAATNDRAVARWARQRHYSCSGPHQQAGAVGASRAAQHPAPLPSFRRPLVLVFRPQGRITRSCWLAYLRPLLTRTAPSPNLPPPGVLGDNVTVTRDKTKITVTSEIQMSKRYLKYLTKKYLKKVRSWPTARQPWAEQRRSGPGEVDGEAPPATPCLLRAAPSGWGACP